MHESPAVTRLRHEPFRLFFPLAVLITVGGVLLWPMLHFGYLSVYPGTMHARVMTVGFGGFLLGFLATATPRLLDSSSLRLWEVALLLVLWLGSVGAHFCSRHAWGDGLFAACLIFFVGALLMRWKMEAKDTPPPGFPVALAGLLVGGLGAAGLAWRSGAWMSSIDFGFARLLLYQGMALLALIGVGPFLLPRFLGLPSPHRFDETLDPPRGWWSRFLVCGVAGLMVVVSFAVEAAGWARAGMLLRAGVFLGYFLFETPLFRRSKILTTPATAVRIALSLIVIALVWAGFDPLRRVGILHLFLVAGTGMAMMAVAVRVVLGHVGRHDLLGGRIWWLRIAAGLIVLAALTRVSAEFSPKIRESHLDYAAVTWVAVAVLWLWKLGRFFFSVEKEDAESVRQCPRAQRRLARRKARLRE